MLSEAPFRSRIKARQTCPGLQVPKVTIQNISINLHGSQIHAAGRGKSWKLKVPPAKLSLSPSCTAVSTEPRNSVRTRDPAPHRQRQRCRSVLRPLPGPTGAPRPHGPTHMSRCSRGSVAPLARAGSAQHSQSHRDSGPAPIAPPAGGREGSGGGRGSATAPATTDSSNHLKRRSGAQWVGRPRPAPRSSGAGSEGPRCPPSSGGVVSVFRDRRWVPSRPALSVQLLLLCDVSSHPLL